MKVLLRKNIEKLGIVGDVVNVANGYARNYLLPQGLATAPTNSNMRMLADARKQAELEREEKIKELQAHCAKMEGAEVTIQAKANPEGVLYGSVGKREIVDALVEQGHIVHVDQIVLKDPIRRIDSTDVEVKFADDLKGMIKVTVVRESEGAAEGESEGADATTDGEAEGTTGTEAATDGDGGSE